MPFLPFEPIKPADRDDTGVKVSLAKLRGAPAVLRIVVAQSALAQVCPGGDGQGYAVLLGEGPDHGLIRLQPVRPDQAVVKARFATAKSSTFARIALGHVARFVDEKQKAERVQWELLEDGTIEIALPPWADKTRPRAAAKIAAVPPDVAAGQRDQERQVTERAEAQQRREARDPAAQMAAGAREIQSRKKR